jgi:hypothetical protein
MEAATGASCLREGDWTVLAVVCKGTQPKGAPTPKSGGGRTSQIPLRAIGRIEAQVWVLRTV